MKKFMIIIGMLSIISACSDASKNSQIEEVPNSDGSNTKNILSLVSVDAFSKYKFKDLIEPTNQIKTINGCDVNPIYIQKAIYIQCSKKGLSFTNALAKTHVSTYPDLHHILDQGQMDYRWSTEGAYCTLSVKEEEDIFEMYCVSRDWENGVSNS